MRRPRGWKLWGGLAVAGVILLGIAGPYVYIHYIEGDPPAPLDARATSSPQPVVGTVEGTWSVASGSQAGYRVKEVLAGQQATAVGRTDKVTGSLTVAGATVTRASFDVDLASVSSDQGRRDDSFRGQIMQTDRFPTATFVLASPVALGALATTGGTQQLIVSGRLTLHGVTKEVTFPLAVVRSEATVTASGQVPVVFADYGVANPSIGGFVTTDDKGVVEVLLHLTKVTVP